MKNYDFLSQVRQEELATIKESLAKAKRLLASSPAALREERQLEVDVSSKKFLLTAEMPPAVI